MGKTKNDNDNGKDQPYPPVDPPPRESTPETREADHNSG